MKIKPVWFLAVIITAAFSVGCVSTDPTAYQKHAHTGGYSERRDGPKSFTVWFSGNGYTAKTRAEELCLLRCAELTLGGGWSYFLVRKQDHQNSQSTTGGGNAVYLGYGMATSFNHSQVINKPGIRMSISCFKTRPSITGEVHDARSLWNRLSAAYGVAKSEPDKVDAVDFTLSWTDSRNKKRLSAIGRSSETPRVIEDDGQFLFVEMQYHAAEENPFDSVSDLKDYLAKAAKAAGVEAAVFTLGETVRLRNPAAYEAGARMICALGFLPESKLGLGFEPMKSPSDPVIIKRVKNPSAVEAGVLIGDRLMTVNGKDVAVSDMDWVLKRKVGEEVKITIVRDGVEVGKKFKAVANHVPGD